MNSIEKITRRDFAKKIGVTLGQGLILSCAPSVVASALLSKRARADGAADFSPNIFVSVEASGKVRLVCHRSEMGQGIRTSMLMLLAGELDCGPGQVELVQATGDERYGDQNTDGSRSIRKGATRVREAAAAAREMLVAAAAARWSVPASECTTENGKVSHARLGKTLGYGELAPDAAKLPVPAKPKLKQVALEQLGRGIHAVDAWAMVSGRAVYGIDVVREGMLYASVERCPTTQGKLKSVDTDAALAVAGVRKVIKLGPMGDAPYTNAAVAVVATNTWAALEGRRALNAQWDMGPAASAGPTKARLERALNEGAKRKSYRVIGDYAAASAKASRKLKARYHTPFLVHAPMEPPNAVAHVRDGKCELWVPSQDPQTVRKAVGAMLGFNENDVIVNVTLLGGGFGRKSQPDFALEAAAIANQAGAPVKVTWTREDEIRHGFYHAECLQDFEAALDAGGKVSGWRHRSAFPTITTLFDARSSEPGDWEMGMGASNFPYRVPNVLCEGASVPCDVRVAWLRSVCNVFHSFGVNSFFDELAHDLKRDPVDLRRELLEPRGRPDWDAKAELPFDTGRLADVITEVEARSGWKTRKKKKGHGWGFAAHYSFFSYVAVALEVAVAAGKVSVKRVVIGIDAGSLANADAVRAQMEGSVVFGLSAALHGRIDVEGGAVAQSNFHDYPVLRLDECPEIEVVMVKSDAPPAGVGEPGVPPVAPALCNAIFDATGKRLRELPVKL